MFPALLVMVLASPMAPPTKPATPAGSTARRPSITLKWSAPLKMAYREFAGAYWQTGPALRDAQAQMQQAGHLGRLFIRFLENPWSAETTTIKAQVGFIVNQGSRSVQPFQTFLRDAMPTAVMIIERSTPSRRDYAALQQWAVARGYVPSGAVLEIYGPPATAGGGTGNYHTELQLELLPNEATARDRSPTAPEKAVDDGEPRVEAIRKIPDPADPGNEEVPSSPGDPPAKVSALTLDAQDGPLRTPIANENRNEDEGPPAPRKAPDNRTGITDTSDSRGNGPASPSQTARTERPPGDESLNLNGATSLESLVERGAFDQAAALIVPNKRLLDPINRLWLEQVFFRIKAINARLGTKPSPKTDRIARLTSAVIVRRRRAMAQANDPADSSPAIHTYPVATDATGRHKREVLAKLDRLMGRLAYGPIEAREIEPTLLDILEQLKTAISDMPRSSPSTPTENTP